MSLRSSAKAVLTLCWRQRSLVLVNTFRIIGVQESAVSVHSDVSPHARREILMSESGGETTDKPSIPVRRRGEDRGAAACSAFEFGLIGPQKRLHLQAEAPPPPASSIRCGLQVCRRTRCGLLWTSRLTFIPPSRAREEMVPDWL
ncbi:hypothetical protein EYF80_029600 [Liparis tanakae]|uniref:Uncharacterized protein n=1 Tax=Liparis tanakae TaxID=230148 RepID=A0A4Z2H2Q5_9TELE|nr:hypothetical protein EYF80_029600 [Liparis tanakae]